MEEEEEAKEEEEEEEKKEDMDATLIAEQDEVEEVEMDLQSSSPESEASGTYM